MSVTDMQLTMKTGCDEKTNVMTGVYVLKKTVNQPRAVANVQGVANTRHTRRRLQHPAVKTAGA